MSEETGITFKSMGTCNFLAAFSPSLNISYNPSTGAFGKEETAILANGSHYILKGDWRAQYTDAFEQDGIDGIWKVWEDNKGTHKSYWSTGE
jgi:hypothetical protein